MASATRSLDSRWATTRAVASARAYAWFRRFDAIPEKVMLGALLMAAVMAFLFAIAFERS